MSVTRKECEILRAGEESAKLSNQTKADAVPKASSCKKDCTSAWEAGQMKNTSVMMIWGATRM